jgi:predicted Rossmann fold nucleotide-binding protein DprA/Smf involved in DNA uptake
VTGILADSLERAALNLGNRDWLLGEQLVLVSPYDPSAGFNVGHAMQRNKLIYALADAALIMSADYEKGGTWAGAIEQLQRLRFVPVYVRSTGDIGRGLQALTKMGAKPWPNPQNSDQFLAVFDESESTPDDEQSQLAFQSTSSEPEEPKEPLIHPPSENASNTPTSGKILEQESHFCSEPSSEATQILTDHIARLEPAGSLIGCVRDILVRLLLTPKSESEIASILQVSTAQTKVWLQKFIDEEVLDKRLRPVRYVVRQKTLL